MRRAFIPPVVLQHISERGSEAQRARARKSALLTERLRGRREATTLYEPQHGERRQVRDAQNREGTGDLPVVRAEDSPEGPDEAANTIYDTMGETFDHLYDLFQRRSYDNANGMMIGLAHYGESYDNAFWDGARLAIGDGDVFPPLWKAPTVIYHELGHAVTQYTCRLVYANQPGCLNESGSDILAALVEQWRKGETAAQADWLVGHELFDLGHLSGRALRDMLRRGPAYDDPLLGRDPQPDTMDDYVEGSDVHEGSSIPNRVFAEACLLAGGRSWETIGPIWYDCWTTRMGPRTSFAEWAAAMLASAEALRGSATHQHVEALRAALEVVKLTPAGTAPAPAPSGPSPCTPDLLALLQDAEVVGLLGQLAKRPSVRRFLARIHAATKA